MKKRSVPVLGAKNHPTLAKTEIVLEATGVWAVVHRGKNGAKPVSLVVEKAEGVNWRYPKTVFTSPAFARNLAKRLNVLFGTDAYDVEKLA